MRWMQAFQYCGDASISMRAIYIPKHHLRGLITPHLSMLWHYYHLMTVNI